MEVRVYLLRTWGWAGVLMALALLCGVHYKLTDGEIVQLCPGQYRELSCMADEEDSIVWNGSAFSDQCPNEADAIRVARNESDLDIDSNSTTLHCGRFMAENRLINTTDPKFPDLGYQIAIESNLLFVINDTNLSGNVNILCNIGLQDMPKVNTTIVLHDIKPTNLSFDQSNSSQTFYWDVDNESECNLTFTVTITGISSSDFSPLTLSTTGGGVFMACPTLITGIYEFIVNSTSGSVMAPSSPCQFNVSNRPQPITDVKISNKTCNSSTITFSTSTQCEKYTIVAVLKNAPCQEDQEEKTNSSVSGTSTIDLVYNFSGLEQNVTYCVCAMILDLANNAVQFCGSDLPRNGNFTTKTMCSGSVRVLHFRLHFVLIATLVLWILFVL